MNRPYRLGFSLIVLICAVVSKASFAQIKKLPNIVILATGGTIAGAAATGTQAAYTSGAVGIDTMIAAVPGIKELANIKGEQISSVGSQDMTFAILLTAARRINVLLAQKDVDGIVVTHGTDTLEESAYFLNLVVKSEKPVVLVGSMRPSTAVSADGPLNLYNAVGVAVDPQSKGRGVLVVMNDWIHGAHSLTKTSTTAVQTFMSPLRGLVGVANYGKNDYYNNPVWKHTAATEFDVANVTNLPRVDILYAYADMPPDLIDASVKNGAKGIVIAGVGNGNMNKSSLEAAARAAQAGVVIVRSTRVATGTVGRNVEVNDDQMNFIASDELNPQKARVLLMFALLKPRTNMEIQNLFYTY
jgi:L-asparaginase